MAKSRVTLKAALARQRKTQAEMAKAMNVSDAQMSRWINGKRRLTFKDGQRLARLLGIRAELLDG